MWEFAFLRRRKVPLTGHGSHSDLGVREKLSGPGGVARPAIENVEYSVTTSTLSADPSRQGLVPGIKIQIGEEEVPVLNVHTVQIRAARGSYITAAKLALDFSEPARIYGQVLQTLPSSAHTIDCRVQLSVVDASSDSDVLKRGISCDLSPLSDGVGYSIGIASNQAAPPKVQMVGRRIEIRDVGEAAAVPDVGELIKLMSEMGIIISVYMDVTSETSKKRVDRQQPRR